MLLCQRILDVGKPENLELVLVVTGAEEASLMGATALARDRAAQWDRSNTVVLALDGLCNGELRCYAEGEVVPHPTPTWLADTLATVADSDPRYAGVRPYTIPAGGTDAFTFLAQGYDAVALGCVDPERGAPHHYHQMSDTPENLDPAEILLAVDFAEDLIAAMLERRLG